MFKPLFLSFALAAICSCASTSANARQSVRLDATSDTTARESFKRMLSHESRARQQQLSIAMLKLNLVGVRNAYELVASPERQSPSIVQIKDRVAGMTADEIIDLADRTSEVKIEIQRK
ncbi:MAG: hypothetical protein ACOH2M_30105 [Cypionkella sp.]